MKSESTIQLFYPETIVSLGRKGDRPIVQWWTRGNKWECDLHKSIALSAILMAHHDVTRMAHWSILCAVGPMHKSIAPSALYEGHI